MTPWSRQLAVGAMIDRLVRRPTHTQYVAGDGLPGPDRLPSLVRRPTEPPAGSPSGGQKHVARGTWRTWQSGLTVGHSGTTTNVATAAIKNN